MLIAMAGLPGTGKSTLAARIATALGGVVISKDVVRAALFPSPVLDYSPAQDDTAMTAVFAAARLVLATDPTRVVIIDGRTFRKRTQVEALTALGHEIGMDPVVIECVCEGAIARERLDRDALSGAHPAANRTSALYEVVRTTIEPLTIPRLTLDTGRLSPEDCLARILEYIPRGCSR